jgi:hypothetical protein
MAGAVLRVQPNKGGRVLLVASATNSHYSDFDLRFLSCTPAVSFESICSQRHSMAWAWWTAFMSH